MKRSHALIGTGIIGAAALGGALLLSPRLRADALDGRFVVNGVGDEVADSVTGLTWQRAASATSYDWAAAPGACGAGWRLPTIDELYTLVDIRSGSYLDTRFSNGVSTIHWSATPVSGDASLAWDLNFASGHVNNTDKAGLYAVRCVK